MSIYIKKEDSSKMNYVKNLYLSSLREENNEIEDTEDLYLSFLGENNEKYTEVEFIQNNKSDNSTLPPYTYIDYHERGYTEAYIDTGISGLKTIILRIASAGNSDYDGYNDNGARYFLQYFDYLYNDLNMPNFYFKHSLYWSHNDPQQNLNTLHLRLSDGTHYTASFKNKQIIEVKINVKVNNKNTCVINNESFSINSLITSLNSELKNKNISLFGAGGKVRLYGCKIYEDPEQTIILRDFIPCIRDSDNIAGLYDKVSKNFFTNSNPDSERSQNKIMAGPKKYRAVKKGQIKKGYIGIDNIPKIFYSKNNRFINYTRLNYITKENTSSVALIDTEIITNKATGINISFSDYKGIGLLFGYKDSDNYNWYLQDTSKQVGNTFDYVRSIKINISSKEEALGYVENEEITSVFFNFQNDNKYYIKNGQNYIEKMPDFENSNIATLLLFAYRNKESSIGLAKNFKLYHCIITEDNVIIRNFIPAMRNFDGEIGLYDTVNNEFYYSPTYQYFTTNSFEEEGEEEESQEIICPTNINCYATPCYINPCSNFTPCLDFIATCVGYDNNSNYIVPNSDPMHSCPTNNNPNINTCPDFNYDSPCYAQSNNTVHIENSSAYNGVTGYDITGKNSIFVSNGTYNVASETDNYYVIMGNFYIELIPGSGDYFTVNRCIIPKNFGDTCPQFSNTYITCPRHLTCYNDFIYITCPNDYACPGDILNSGYICGQRNITCPGQDGSPYGGQVCAKNYSCPSDSMCPGDEFWCSEYP